MEFQRLAATEGGRFRSRRARNIWIDVRDHWIRGKRVLAHCLCLFVWKKVSCLFPVLG